MQISSGKPSGSVPVPLADALAADPSGPLLTYYDDATGERTELSATALANWVIKTANLLADECVLGPGDRAAVTLPPHWQTAAVLLGAWTAGLSVTLAPSGAAAPTAASAVAPGGAAGRDDRASLEEARQEEARQEKARQEKARQEKARQPEAWQPDVTFTRLADLADPAGGSASPAAASRAAASRAAASGAGEHRFVLGLDPMGAPLPEVPAGYLDYIAEVRGQPDQLVQPVAPPAGEVPGSYLEWLAAGRAAAEAAGLRAGDRLLVDADRYPQPVDWLLAPLAAGASVVLGVNLDPARVAERVSAERVTRTL